MYYAFLKKEVIEIVYLENLDLSDLVEEHLLHEAENSDQDMVEMDCVNKCDTHDEKSSAKGDVNPQVNELQVL